MQTQYQHQIVESLSFFIAPFIAKPKLLHYLPSVLLLISEKSGNCLDVANIMSVGVVVLVCKKILKIKSDKHLCIWKMDFLKSCILIFFLDSDVEQGLFNTIIVRDSINVSLFSNSIT